MTAFLAGIALLAFPLVLAFLFQDRMKGFLWVFAAMAVFEICLAIGLQAAHAFAYPVLVSVHAAADAAILFVFLKKKKALAGCSIAFLPLLAFCVLFLDPASVHYHYTGQVQTIRGAVSVVDSSYAYPLFSDEWAAAALAQRSIESRSLPTADPFAENAPFANLLVPFDSVLAELFLILGLAPVGQFAVLAILAGLALSLALYICLRSLGAGRIAAVIALLSAPFIAEGANLPGMWFLLPYLASAIPLFFMLAAVARKIYSVALVYGALAVILYPPSAVFVLPALIAVGWTERRTLASWLVRGSRPLATVVAALVIVSAGILVLLPSSLRSSLFAAVAFGLFHANLDSGIVSYPIEDIIPVFLLPFSALGLWLAGKRKQAFFLAPIGVGIAYWTLYAFDSDVIVIEYPRIVIIVSLLLVVAAGLGIDQCIRWISERIQKPSYRRTIATAASALVLVSFALAVPGYARVVSRHQFILAQPSGGNIILAVPALAINRYLTPDDLAIWRGISGATFTAPPWKGLVIAAATGNYPLETKASFVGTDILSYDRFMAADCADKAALAETYAIAYAYSDAFSCPGFEGVATSSESLHLYKWSPDLFTPEQG